MKKDRVLKFEEFVNESLDNNVWYTTSEEMSIEEFIEIEVEERENYELEEIEEWMEMYNITEDSELLWVATTPAMAARYSMDTELWNDDLYIEEYNKDPESWYVREILASAGTIIEESEDGEGGYIMVLN